jgi:hypothetical protein
MLIVTYIRSTPERRAKLLVIKQMIDEAHRLREHRKIIDYANIIADIYMARIKLDPESIEEIPQAEQSANYIRSCGKQLGNTPTNHTNNQLVFLDNKLKSQSRLLVLFENQLRTSFTQEMLGGQCPEYIQFI